GWSNLQVTPITCPEEADVRVVVRQMRLRDIEGEVWRCLTVYMNDRHITTYAKVFDEAGSSWSLSFIGYDTGVTTYTDVRIPELGETAEYGTLDPGEVAAGGLPRTLEGRYINWFVRYDGSLRAWRPKSVPSAYTYSSDTYSESV